MLYLHIRLLTSVFLLPYRCTSNGPSSVTDRSCFKILRDPLPCQNVFELCVPGLPLGFLKLYGQRKSDTPTFVNLVCVPRYEIRFIGYVGTDDLNLSRLSTARSLTLLKIMSDTSFNFLVVFWTRPCPVPFKSGEATAGTQFRISYP
jgi:hypothetical protein